MSEPAGADSAHSLDPIFSPRRVAVIGATRRRESLGFKLLHNLAVNEFNGALFPINPKADVVLSHKAYPTIAAVPDPVDMAVIMVPRNAVRGVVAECLEARVRGLVMITAGFAETGAEGTAIERELTRMVRAAGTRMIGPNCMGVINTDPEVSMDATFSPTPALHGSIGFVSQSGALGVAVLNAASDLGVGLSQFVSVGNKADVSGNDLLEYWEQRDDTRVICMYLESFGNPRRFTEIAKRVGRKIPILVVKSGRTAAGARAATSHTGAIAGADVTISTFLAQCGVIRADTIGELFDLARAFDRCPLPSGNRVAIVTNAGGPGILATDACANLELEIARLSADSRERIAGLLPPEASVENPVDMIASAGVEEYRGVLRAVLDDDGVDMALVINVTPILSSPLDIMNAIGEVTAGADKPVLAVMMATEDFYETVKLRSDLPPVYRFPESAARVLSRLHRYAQWRRKPERQAVPEFEVDDAAVAALLDDVGEGHLGTAEAIRLLQLYGIPVAGWRAVDEGTELRAAAAELGYPVALKAEAEGLIHKSDIGAVKVGLEDEGALLAAVGEIEASLAEAGYRPSGWLVQEMVSEGLEVIFGISNDPRFGPLLMFGLGGRYVEVLKDVTFGVTPMAPVEAHEMIEGIRGVQLLEGVRGEPAVDKERLVEVLLRLSQLAQRHPRIQELDINPFLATPGGDDAVALDVRVRAGAASVP